jgi:hypothetical protein
MKRDLSLDALLELDGQTFVVDPETEHWVRFMVRRVPVSEERPHGLVYSLTLHGPGGVRLVGFDNAHAVLPRRRQDRRRRQKDHRHRFKMVRPYECKDAASLLVDFWAEVESVLRERGVKI